MADLGDSPVLIRRGKPKLTISDNRMTPLAIDVATGSFNKSLIKYQNLNKNGVLSKLCLPFTTAF